MIFAAILAGGIGKRIERTTLPKQFITIGGTPIIILSLREFMKNRRFERIYVAVNADWREYLEELLKSSFTREEAERIEVVNGGRERLDSFLNVMEAVVADRGVNEEDILICHDSVRPFVTQTMINDCIDATLSDGLALTVVPTTEVWVPVVSSAASVVTLM